MILPVWRNLKTVREVFSTEEQASGRRALKHLKKALFLALEERIFTNALLRTLMVGEWSESLKIGGPHNIYVCILVSSGALGFCLMMGFFIYTFVKSGLTLLKKITVADMWLFISFLLTGVFYVTEFVEARILYQVGIFNVLFWIYCGYMYAFAKLTTEEKRAGEIID